LKELAYAMKKKPKQFRAFAPMDATFHRQQILAKYQYQSLRTITITSDSTTTTKT